MLTWEKNSDIKLNTNQIVVWFIDLTKINNIDHYYAALSIAEQQHADNLKLTAVKNEFVITRGFLRQLLAEFLNQPANSITLLKAEKGKPYLANNELQFNVSHTKSAAVITMSLNIILGIDIEDTRRKADFTAVIPQVFTEDEQQFIQQADNLSAAFFRCWTRKEALIKAMGEGMFAQMKKLSTLKTQHWEIIDLPDVEDFYLTLACAEKPDSVTLLKVN